MAELRSATCGFSLAMIAQRTLDEDVRVALVPRAARPGGDRADRRERPADAARPRPTARRAGGRGRAFLRSLVQGRTNAEIADELGIDEDDVVRRLGELFTRIGASSRAEATAFAFRERVL